MSIHCYKDFLVRSSQTLYRYPHPFVHDAEDLDYTHDTRRLEKTRDKHQASYDAGIHPQEVWFAYSLKNTLDIRLLRLRISIQSKSDWRRKINNNSVVSRWRSECKVLNLPRGAFNFLMEEMRHIDDYGLKFGYLRTCVDGAWYSDSLVPDDLSSQFRGLMKNFEHDIDRRGKRDWHPLTNETVWDLVHPSLYPYIHGVTKVVDKAISIENCMSSMNTGTVRQGSMEFVESDNMEERVDSMFCSQKFQWLPANVDIDGDGKAVFKTYINNLHPEEYAELYQVLGQILSKFVSLFEKVLTDLLFPIRRPTTVEIEEPSYDEDTDDESNNSAKTVEDNESNSPDDERFAEEINGNSPCRFGKEENVDLADQKKLDVNAKIDSLEIDTSPAFNFTTDFRVQRSIRRDTRKLDESIGQFEPFDGHGTERENISVSLRNSKIQVIVKLANIELTATNPTYVGGAWHVEGCNNEKIVATGIYYYDMYNITESKLEFRQAVNAPMYYAQNDDVGARKVFGLGRFEKLSQPAGEVIVQSGRCLAFPNVYQHRVAPFSMDMSGSEKTSDSRGYRKMLVFFLIDPNQEIVSTANVPPQDQTWFIKEIAKEVREGKVNEQCADEKCRCRTNSPTYFQLLDNNVLERTIDKLEFPISLSEAKKIRMQVMEERKFIVGHTNKELFERQFSLCEH